MRIRQKVFLPNDIYELLACSDATYMQGYDTEDYSITIVERNAQVPTCPTAYTPAANATNITRSPMYDFTWLGSTGGTNTTYDFQLAPALPPWLPCRPMCHLQTAMTQHTATPGCWITSPVFVLEKLTIRSYSTQDATCATNGSGKLQVSIAGGIQPYLVAYNESGNTGHTAYIPDGNFDMGASPGVFTINVTDASGCTHNRFRKWPSVALPPLPLSSI